MMIKYSILINLKTLNLILKEPTNDKSYQRSCPIKDCMQSKIMST